MDAPSFEVEGHTLITGEQSISFSVKTSAAKVTTNESPVGGYCSNNHLNYIYNDKTYNVSFRNYQYFNIEISILFVIQINLG